MVDSIASQHAKRARLSPATCRVTWLMLGCVMLSMSGCGGCRQETAQERKARLLVEEEKRKQREEEEKERKEKEIQFVVESPVTKPSETELKISRAKPGHWMSVTQLMKSKYRDWGGETTLQVVSKENQPVPIQRTPFVLSSSRPVQLAKGRPRQIENVFLVPQSTASTNVQCTLRERNYGAVVGGLPRAAPLAMMQSYQYFFVVLAKEPERYTFLKSLNGVRVPQDSIDDSADLLHYQVLLPNITQQIPLPDNSLCWTTIAFILWDEVDPASLDRQRREALIDWLHWGGQLVVNGPDSLKLLENSFLAPYLPATDGGATNITQADVETLAKFWTPKARRRRGARPPKQLKLTNSWSGINLNLAEGVVVDRGLAESTGGLLVERQVGRGRIVVSRMQLAERELLTWSPHYDNLFNGGIMRRPPRRFSAGQWGSIDGGLGALHTEWAKLPGRMHDAQYVTNLRLFSRDEHDSPDATNWRRVENVANPNNNQFRFGNTPQQKQYDFKPPEFVGGIGAWNDFNATSNAARAALREAAGVRVPHASFVVTCLAVYLVVLVPLNWLFFKALGRVEYAWVAAPLIALAGTAVVVKQAQLDIGFVRAQTEIGLLEIQGDYPRAHLSRYTALYTSLSTSYDLQFDDPTAVAAPFPTRADYEMMAGQTRSNVELTQAKKVQLAGLQVSSASTDMLHSEQMLELDGPIAYTQEGPNQWRVRNRSQLKIESSAIVKRADQGGEPRLLGCWIGELPPGEGKTVTFAPLTDSVFANQRDKDIARAQEEDKLNLMPLYDLALDASHVPNGDVRMVGRIDKVLPGVTITPSAAQVRGAAFVVAHLKRAELPLPVSDVNSPRDIITTARGLQGEDFGESFD